MFDNAISHVIYLEDALHVVKMNKGPGGQQLFLRDGWFEIESQRHSQPMSYIKSKDTILENSQTQPVFVQKDVQMILKEQGLWPTKRFKLVCPILECLTCQATAKCKVCIKGSQCNSSLEKKFSGINAPQSMLVMNVVDGKNNVNVYQSSIVSDVKAA